MIRLNVFIRVEAAHREQVMELAARLVAASQKDEGCVAYDLFESATRKDVLMICETWSDMRTLVAHQKAAHFAELVPELERLAEMKVEKFEF